jgi:hypothetical protein
MENQHPSVSQSKDAPNLNPDIQPVAPAILAPHASEIELAVLGGSELPAEIASGLKPRSKISLAAILVALNVRKLCGS